ncbi:MAG: (d)CMP kinase [Nitrospirae bacterium]|nr:(d)CMP kinase [Nitrospirota bacterium]
MKDIITIDGPSGAGKSTIARLLAKRLGYKYLDTGALYRAVAWKIKQDNINTEDKESLIGALSKINITFDGEKIMANGTDITSDIRTPEISELSSKVSVIPIIRDYLFTIQREIGLRGKTVIEGRDIGTVIFPEAENKFFLDASFEERGRRRHKELKEKGGEVSLKDTINDITARDNRDSTRQSAPLKKTGDMVYIDSSNLTVEEVIAKIMASLRTS